MARATKTKTITKTVTQIKTDKPAKSKIPIEKKVKPVKKKVQKKKLKKVKAAVKSSVKTVTLNLDKVNKTLIDNFKTINKSLSKSISSVNSTLRKNISKPAVKTAEKQITINTQKPASLPDEEVAFRMVKLYFEEVARLGFKRTLDLDAIINAYFYSLTRLHRKETEMKLIREKVLKEESELAQETKEELFPEPGK